MRIVTKTHFLLLCVSAFFTSHLVFAQEDSGTLPARDLFPAWSPDGSKIAFQSTAAGNSDIYVMDADGGNRYALTKELSGEFYPSWLPGGTRILFQSDRGGRADIGTQDLDIYTVAVDGSAAYAIVTHASNDFFPQLSPDTLRIAYVSDERADRSIYNIYVEERVTGERTNITPGFTQAFAPTWSPDGTQIAFSAPNRMHENLYDIYVVNVDGTGLRNLTDNPGRHEFTAKWSPDGQKIAFQAGWKGPAHIGTIDVETGEMEQLTFGEWGNETPAWSPDGSRIAFTSYRDGNAEIYVMKSDGTEQIRLTEW